jgi:hypothetical protein
VIADNWGHSQSEEPSFKENSVEIQNIAGQLDPNILQSIYNGLCSCPESHGKETLRQTLEGMLNSGNDPLPYETSVSQNFPNPFNAATSFVYSIKSEAHVEIVIYDIRGRIVKTLINEIIRPGHYTATWDGADSNGNPMPSGIYFYRLKTAHTSQARKMLLLK